jgi:hypothetical protein
MGRFPRESGPLFLGRQAAPDPVIQDPVIQDPVIRDPVMQDRVIRDRAILGRPQDRASRDVARAPRDRTRTVRNEEVRAARRQGAAATAAGIMENEWSKGASTGRKIIISWSSGAARHSCPPAATRGFTESQDSAERPPSGNPGGRHHYESEQGPQRVCARAASGRRAPRDTPRLRHVRQRRPNIKEL